MRNIAIVAKGPSVLKGYTELYEQFDTIIGVNWPVYTDELKKCLPSRIDIMSSCLPIYSPHELKKYPMEKNYTQEQVENLKIKYILCLMGYDHPNNDRTRPHDTYIKFYNKYINGTLHDELVSESYPPPPCLPAQYTMDYYKSDRKHYNLKHMTPSTGTKTLEYFSLKEEIENIFFIGFDAYTKGGYFYHYPSEDHRNYTGDCHDREKTIEYMQNLGKIFPDKNYHYISEIDFEDYENFNKVDGAITW